MSEEIKNEVTGSISLEQQVLDLKKQNEDMVKMIKSLSEKTDKSQNQEAAEKNLLQKTREETKLKSERDHESRKLEAGASYVTSFDSWLSDHEKILSNASELKSYKETVDKAKFDSLLDKANELRKGTISSMFGLRENMDLLTPTQRKKIEEYLNFSEEKQRKESEEYFECVDSVVNIKKLQNKAVEALKAKQTGGIEHTDAIKRHNQKFFAMASRLLKTSSK